MTTEEHDEERIRRAVIEAVDRVEGPDRARLAQIEQRLIAGARRPRRTRWWWPLVGLALAAGGAAAYWGLYGGTQGKRVQTPEPVVDESAPAASDQDGAGGGDTGGERSPDRADHEDGSKIIYMGD